MCYEKTCEEEPKMGHLYLVPCYYLLKEVGFGLLLTRYEIFYRVSLYLFYVELCEGTFHLPCSYLTLPALAISKPFCFLICKSSCICIPIPFYTEYRELKVYMPFCIEELSETDIYLSIQNNYRLDEGYCDIQG
jgi:hypothetical protein